MRWAILAATVLAAAATGVQAQANCGAMHDAQASASAPNQQAAAPATSQPAQTDRSGQSLDQATNQAAKTPQRVHQ
jgi:hypothetical protein